MAHHLDYLQDIADSAILNTPVPFTIKYPHIEHYSQILQHQQILTQLICQIIRQQAQTTVDLPTLISQCPIEEEYHDALTQVLKNMYPVYKKQLIKKQITQGSLYLKGFNWRIKVIMTILKNITGCSEFTHKNKLILQIEFGVGEEVVSLEMGVHEARELLVRFKKIRKQMKEEYFDLS